MPVAVALARTAAAAARVVGRSAAAAGLARARSRRPLAGLPRLPLRLALHVRELELAGRLGQPAPARRARRASGRRTRGRLSAASVVPVVALAARCGVRSRTSSSGSSASRSASRRSVGAACSRRVGTVRSWQVVRAGAWAGASPQLVQAAHPLHDGARVFVARRVLLLRGARSRTPAATSSRSRRSSPPWPPSGSSRRSARIGGALLAVADRDRRRCHRALRARVSRRLPRARTRGWRRRGGSSPTCRRGRGSRTSTGTTRSRWAAMRSATAARSSRSSTPMMRRNCESFTTHSGRRTTTSSARRGRGAAIGRLPDRFPLMVRFYDNLFAGRLGFERGRLVPRRSPARGRRARRPGGRGGVLGLRPPARADLPARATADVRRVP